MLRNLQKSFFHAKNIGVKAASNKNNNSNNSKP